MCVNSGFIQNNLSSTLFILITNQLLRQTVNEKVLEAGYGYRSRFLLLILTCTILLGRIDTKGVLTVMCIANVGGYYDFNGYY
jgi:hypothetical protein